MTHGLTPAQLQLLLDSTELGISPSDDRLIERLLPLARSGLLCANAQGDYHLTDEGRALVASNLAGDVPPPTSDGPPPRTLEER